jgi:hypothetical protein
MTDPVSRRNGVRAAAEQLRAVLRGAVGQRDQRPELVETDGGSERAWVLFERQEMLTAVNVLRVERDLPPIGIEVITRMDLYATGHVDWFEKFSWSCAELMMTENRWTT